MQALTDAVGRFVLDFNYKDWYGMNPSHKPLSARTPEQILMVLRCSVPEAIGKSDAVLATALAESNHPLKNIGGCWYVN